MDIDLEFIKAVVSNNLILAKEYLDLGANINSEFTDGNTLIHFSNIIEYNYIKFLIDNGIDIHRKDFNGLNILHILMLNNCTDKQLIKLIIDNGININEKVNDSISALMIAAMHSNYTNIDLLLTAGANIDDQVEYNWIHNDYIYKMILYHKDLKDINIGITNTKIH